MTPIALEHTDPAFDRLQEIFGGNAVSDEYGIGRHVANLFVTQTYEVRTPIFGARFEAKRRIGSKRHSQPNIGWSHHRDTGLCVNGIDTVELNISPYYS